MEEQQNKQTSNQETAKEVSPVEVMDEIKPESASEIQQEQGLSIASLVLGIISFLCGGFPVAIAAIICGHIALGKVQRGECGGKGMAKAGLILGYSNLIITVLFIVLWLIFFVVGAGAAMQQGPH